eukprot:COSAG02_NODE_7244_length_3099_cov_4.686366_2_plen_583_part_00
MLASAHAGGGAGSNVALPVRSLNGGTAPPLQATRLERQSAGAPSARVQLVGAGDRARRQNGAHRLAAHRTMSDIGTTNGAATRGVNVETNRRLAAFRTLSEPAVPEGTPPSPQMRHSADLELAMRAGATETALHALQRRTNGLTDDLNAMAEAFGTLNATVTDSSEGLSLLMDVMDTSVTFEQLAATERRLQSAFEAAVQDRLKPIEEAARADAAELVAMRELMTREAAAAAERVAKLETQQVKTELRLVATEELASRMDTQTKRSADTVAACREAVDQNEERFAARMEEELQGFARSFGKAASSMNTVVQAVDHKMQMSLETLTQSMEACNVSNVLQISQLADYLSKSLKAAQQRANETETAMELIASRIGVTQKELQRIATNAQDQAHTACKNVSSIPLLQSEFESLKACLEGVSQSSSATETAISDIKVELKELTRQVHDKAVGSSGSPSFEARMEELESAAKALDLRVASIQELSSQSPTPQNTDSDTQPARPGTLLRENELEHLLVAKLPAEPVAVLRPAVAADKGAPLVSPAISEPTASDGRSEQKLETNELPASSDGTLAATPAEADGAGKEVDQ